MDTREAVAKRIYELCDERSWSPNHLANVSAVPQATIKSILNFAQNFAHFYQLLSL